MAAENTADLDRLTKQLYYLPAIIGRMGINIAEAQAALNADYVRTIGNLLILMKHSLEDMDATAIADILREMAPSRYQFTESTIRFRADLSESADLGGSGGVGFGMGGFMLNASASAAFGYDYRAAATITSVLHAIPADKDFGQTLLDRSKTLNDKVDDLPERSAMEEMVWNEMDKVRQLLGGAKLPDPPKKKLPAKPKKS